MSKVHLLTVGEGDCTIIQHDSERVTMIDICGGNRKPIFEKSMLTQALDRPRGNFAMCQIPTNPIEYLKGIGVTQIFRFILSHPDMDHLDGFNNLMNNFTILNFWDSGARKDKPDFNEDGCNYQEEDWDRYVKVKDGGEGITVVRHLAGSSFPYANYNNENAQDIDSLYIASPNQELIDEANKTQDFNDASYIISFFSDDAKFIFPGDAHDNGWTSAINDYKTYIENAAFLLAPHHGRRSNRSWDFLRVVMPGLSLLGCASSEDLAYEAWYNRNLEYFTQNQAGNTVLEINSREIDVYIENPKYAEAAGGNVNRTNRQGYYYLTTISK